MLVLTAINGLWQTRDNSFCIAVDCGIMKYHTNIIVMLILLMQFTNLLLVVNIVLIKTLI